MTRYVKHKTGSVSSVSDEAFVENYMRDGSGLSGVGVAGEKTLHPDWEELSEEDARGLNPQLFGAADPAVEAVQMHSKPTGWVPALVPATENLGLVGQIDSRKLDITAETLGQTTDAGEVA